VEAVSSGRPLAGAWLAVLEKGDAALEDGRIQDRDVLRIQDPERHDPIFRQVLDDFDQHALHTRAQRLCGELRDI
jgi:hypothetical protein